jgi:hypothetical protein
MSNGTIITLKKNTTHDVEPSAASLYQAELAINTADAKIFTKRDDGTVLSQSIGTVQANYFDATTTTADQVIDTFDASLYRSAKYVVQCTHATGGYQTIEILLMHDGTDVFITRYGLMFTGSQLATFDADKSGDDIRLLATPANTNTTFKFTRTVVQA